MRVAYVCADPGVPVFGTKGSSVHVQEIVRGFIARGIQVDIFATRFDGDAPDDLRDAGIHWLSALPKGELAAREKASLGSNQGLRTLLNGIGPFDFVYERYSLWSYSAMEYARDEGIPGILEVNAPLIEEQARHRGLVDRAGAERVAERAFAAASAIVVVSREVGRYLARFPGTHDKIRVIPNGVDADRFTPDVEPAIPRGEDEFRIGFVGTLKPWHGIDVLADAFALVHRRSKRSGLIICGDGPERKSLVGRLEENGVLSAVTLTGATQPDRIPSLLTSLDVAVAPYPADVDFYFSPLKIYEYMAAGLPVVASAVGQIRETLQSGVNGILCPPGDASAFASALLELESDPAKRRRLGAAARRSIVDGGTWSKVVERIVALAASEVPRREASVGAS